MRTNTQLPCARPGAGALLTRGTAIAVSDESILEAQKQLARMEGIFPAPEGAATLAALKELIKLKWVRPEERIVLFNTGSGLKYLSPPGRAA